VAFRIDYPTLKGGEGAIVRGISNYPTFKGGEGRNTCVVK